MYINGKRIILFFFPIALTVLIILYLFGEKTGIMTFQKLSKTKGMVLIPAGNFFIGSDDTEKDLEGIEGGTTAQSFVNNEKPKRSFFLGGFYIDKYEVTNEEYNIFKNESGVQVPAHWENGIYSNGRGLHPITNISWYDASAYCKWAEKRLPTEEEWEKAARGPSGNIYPWGDYFNVEMANFNKGDTVPVGTMQRDKSYYGVFDLAGNVMEWTASWYKIYQGSHYPSDDFGEKYKVIRGATGILIAHYNLTGVFARASNRLFFFPEKKVNSLGFRCAKNI